MYKGIVQSILRGDIGKLDALVAQGFDVHAVSEGDQWNLLHHALVSVSIAPVPEMIRRLIDHGVDVNARDRYGNTPLHYAARWKKPELIEMLLNAGAEVDPVNRDGLTPLRLMLTSKPYNLDAVATFLAHGANPEQRAAGGISVRDYARIIGHDDHALIELFDRYAPPNGDAGLAKGKA